ncbi:MAG: Gx transporter family protein [bacterium]|nr:Gx transporter family protein [bacterium]MDY4098844.1 Gx transporter family protein [Lachnospiraceae bacterium]
MIPSANKFTDRNRRQQGLTSVQKTAYLGLCLALALICSYVEALIPIPIGIPGVKLGLANVVIVGVLYMTNWKDAALVSLSRVLLTGFFFGSLYSILYSLAGAFLSLIVMTCLKKTDQLHLISVSAAGGIAHNAGQFLVAALVLENYRILYYLPVLFLVGMATGVVIGIVVTGVLKRIPNSVCV